MSFKYQVKISIFTYILLFQPQQPLLNYTVEAIGPLSCTKEGIYLVGGALSGTAYIWNVCMQTFNYLICLIFFY